MAGNLVDLAAQRRRRGHNRPRLTNFDRVAPSGTRPALGAADDGNYYWVKFANNNHGTQSVINEVVASVIGEAIGAPVTPWTIVEVPNNLSQILDNRIIEPGPAFGSRSLHAAAESRMEQGIPYVLSDGNINRIPSLIALWELCNALDVQVLFDGSNDMQIYSFDHGLWFGCYPYPWQLNAVPTFAELSNRSGFPEIDHIPVPLKAIPDECWDSAEQALDGLSDETVQLAVDSVPSEWGHTDEQVAALVSFAIDRKPDARKALRRFH